MEVHSSESKSNATAVAGSTTTGTGEATKQKENENGNGATTAVVAANSTVDDSKVRTVGAKASFQGSSFAESSPSGAGMLLLEESTMETMPQYCHQLFASIASSQPSQIDLLMILIYSVALESGFALSRVVAEADLDSTYWGSIFHAKNVDKLSKLSTGLSSNTENFSLRLSLYKFPGAVDSRLVGIQSGDSFIVTITPDNDSPGYSLCLSLPRYVLYSVKSRNIAARFQNLKELAFILKEYIFCPARIDLLELCEVDAYVGLGGIPEEIIFLILSKLKIKDIQSLSKTSQKMRYFCENYRRILSMNSSNRRDSSTSGVPSSASIGFFRRITDDY
ncbi:protein nutcracker [Hermetia illucens]|nr:protein nutcracker [Hermetia illucens]